MTQKNFITLCICLLTVLTVSAQRRTTNVRGYYRKDGTHVSPHVRHYNAGIGSSTTNSLYGNSYSDDSTQSDDIEISSLAVYIPQKGEYQSKSSSGTKNKILPTTLTSEDDSSSDTTKPESSVGVVIYVSVLRYNGKTMDVCPISRDYSGEWDFSKVQHRFSKSSLSADEALQLVSDYDWTVSGNELKKDFTYDYITSKGFPKFLTRTTEAIKLK